jgi:hypothetical protein
MSFSPTTLEPITSILSKGNGGGGGLGGLIPSILDPVTSILGGGGKGGKGKVQQSSTPVSSQSSATMGVASSYVITRQRMCFDPNVFPQVVSSVAHGVPTKVCGQT